AIFLITTVNTSESVYRKIMVQNAVDAATDTVVAWQARGVNFMQHLNNLHYQINAILHPVELLTCCTCMVQGPTCVAGCALLYTLFGTAAGVALMAVAEVLRPVCLDICPLVDNVQFGIATILYQLQQFIAGKWAVFALISANNLARENGADSLESAMKKYAEKNIWAVFRDSAAQIGADINHIDPFVIQNQWDPPRNVYKAYRDNMLSSLPAFTMPFMELNYYENLFDNNSDFEEIDTSIFLGMRRVDDDTGFPWNLNESTVETCATTIPTLRCTSCPPTPTGSPDDPEGENSFSGEENAWGWQDSYWVGHPKYITMMAAVREMANGVGGFGRKPLGLESEAFYDDVTGRLTHYRRIPARRGWYFAPGEAPSMNNPAYMGLASGQVEGEAVPSTPDMKGNAAGGLIPIHIIGRPATDLMIYH
ncbi:MAG: hypothetical protein O2923_05660, partial [Verrucomicrobia bacterium]|nr:hypothetical protein [Verrucomicrobiota bacterium]